MTGSAHACVLHSIHRGGRGRQRTPARCGLALLPGLHAQRDCQHARASDGLHQDTVELLAEPGLSIRLGQLVAVAHLALGVLAASHAGTWAVQHHVEVHAVNTGGGVVLDAQVNVLLNTEAEVAGSAEVLSLQLVLLHLQATLQNVASLLATDL